MSESETLLLLSRGANGLGFNIRGGEDQHHLPNDSGIFVTKIRENGAAAEDGTLQEGDKILEINGVNMNGLKHQAAVDLFLKAGNEVRLKIWSGAEAILMERYARYCKELELAAQRRFRKICTAIIIVTGCCVLAYYNRQSVIDGIKNLSKRFSSV